MNPLELNGPSDQLHPAPGEGHLVPGHRAPDAKPGRGGTYINGVALRAWADPRHAHRTVLRGEAVSLLRISNEFKLSHIAKLEARVAWLELPLWKRAWLWLSSPWVRTAEPEEAPRGGRA